MIISIDGLPGIGKTTLGLRLSKKYNTHFCPELHLPELSRGEYSESEFIKNDIYKMHTARALDLVILDRSFCSTVTFKMAKTRNININSFFNIQRDLYSGEIVTPDLMIIIMSPPSISLLGLKMRGEDDMFSVNFLHDWWSCYRYAAEALNNNGVCVRCIPLFKTPFYRSLIREQKKKC